MPEASIQVGSRIRATWFETNMETSLAGAQMKCGATQISLTGTIKHFGIREGKEFTPETALIFVKPDEGYIGPSKLCPTCGTQEVIVITDWIIEIL